MLANILFYIIFISQIVLISYYYPKKIVNIINNVLIKYPPNSYPKLYPESVTKIEKGLKIYQWLNRAMLVMGPLLLVLYVMLSSEYDNNQKHAEGLPLMYGMVQFIPYILMELAGFKQFKLMKKADTRTSRTADLQPRRLFDFIAPLYIVIAVALYFVNIAHGLQSNQYQWSSELIITTTALTLCNLLFIGLIAFNLRGKKLDPYQDNKDRLKQSQFAIRSMVFISIIASIFIIATRAVDIYNFQAYEIILNSFYMQIIAIFGLGKMLKELTLENINFDVYKATAEKT